MKIMVAEKDFLNNLKSKIIESLRITGKVSPLKLKPGKLVKTYSDGWSIKIGHYHGYKCDAELYLDKFTRKKYRKIMYCISSKENIIINQVIKKASNVFSKPIEIDETHLDANRDIFQLAKPFPDNKFGKPVFEKYDSYKEYYYGVFDLNLNVSRKQNFQDLIDRASDFFITVSNLLINKRSLTINDYPRIENRRKVVSHLMRERSSPLATLRKQNDNFTCQICSFNFQEKYGPYGVNFAEAHHIVPLNSTNKIRRTTVKDLITVCANCHRILHRMNGNRSDIRKLKETINLSS